MNTTRRAESDDARPLCGSVARRARLGGPALALAMGGAFPVYAAAAESPPATIERPMRDPWVPPELRKPAPAPPTQGAALRAQVERKLKAGFDAADVKPQRNR